MIGQVRIAIHNLWAETSYVQFHPGAFQCLHLNNLSDQILRLNFGRTPQRGTITKERKGNIVSENAFWNLLSQVNDVISLQVPKLPLN